MLATVDLAVNLDFQFSNPIPGSAVEPNSARQEQKNH